LPTDKPLASTEIDVVEGVKPATNPVILSHPELVAAALQSNEAPVRLLIFIDCVAVLVPPLFVENARADGLAAR
jgi:hypothetical protein